MIIDLILDRKDGDIYKPDQFYRDILGYGSVAVPICRALDCGTEQDVKKALCNYITVNDYNEKICDYILSVEWLVGCKV